MVRFFLQNRKHCRKRRKCWLPLFYPFSTMFPKSFFRKVIRSRDGVVKGLLLTNTSALDAGTNALLESIFREKSKRSLSTQYWPAQVSSVVSVSDS